MKVKKTHLDFESRSVIDLKVCGTHVYATHPTTDALCMAYSFDDSPVYLWKLGDPYPSDLNRAIVNGSELVAHNASFEFMIWNHVCAPKYGWPKIPIRQFNCTMLRAFAMGLPGKLDTASKAVGLKVEKDSKGQRIMLQLSKPRVPPDPNCVICRGEGFDRATRKTCTCVVWYDPRDTDPKVVEKFQALYKYCPQDVVVEKALDKRILELPKSEKKLWYLDQKINYRGVYCDIPTAKKAIEIVTVEKKQLDARMSDLTSGSVATVNSSVALADWINTFDVYKGARYSKDGPKDDRKGMEGKLRWYKGDPKKVESVGKDVILDLLEMDLPENLREVVLLRQEAAKNSTSKLKKMISGADKDQRLRFIFQFLGAASTGRWAGRRVQPQNMTRPTIKQKQIEEIIAIIEKYRDPRRIAQEIDMFHGPVVSRISDCLRAMLCARPGKKLIGVDFSAIEARVLAWLAGEESVLNVFRTHGMIYEHNACAIYNVNYLENITKDQRQIGKVATLALGYQGGVGAFQSMAKNYFVKVPDKQADIIKKQWRQANPHIVKYWYALEDAAKTAVQNPGRKISVGPSGRKVTFLVSGSFLFCRLPSGRAICYPYPKLKTVTTPWGEDKIAVTYKGEEKGQFVTKVAYGGLLAENITQAVARDLLAEAMIRVEEKGFPIVLHVHDEIVCEVSRVVEVSKLEEIMCILPPWAEGLPIQAEGWEGKRYRK